MTDYLVENLRGMCAFTEPHGRCDQCRELRDFCTPCRAASEIERLRVALQAPQIAVTKHTAQCIEMAMLLGRAGFPEDLPIQDAVRTLITERDALRAPQPQEEKLRELISKWRTKDSTFAAWKFAADELEAAVGDPPEGTR